MRWTTPRRPGETEYLVRGKAKIAEHRSERPARMDGVQKLLPRIDGQTCLRSRSPARPGGVILRSPALVAVAALGPPDQCAWPVWVRGGDPADRSGRGSDAAA